jgi:hypothetical protein
VKRALKVLADREVSPQLGLLKSTLLQLDSSFSERDYGVSSFRDFAERLEKQGFVTLKHSGRTTLVELAEDSDAYPTGAASAAPEHGGAALAASEPQSGAASPGSSERSESRFDMARGDLERLERPKGVPPERHGRGAAFTAPTSPSDDETEEHAAPSNGNIAEGVALIRAILAEATTPPRWPMYVRQLKQFIRNARPDFDERRYGSILDLMRACQKDGFLRLERDRQGGLRVFASGPVKATNLPHGWSTLTSRAAETTDETEPALEAEPAVEPVAQMPPAVVEDEDNRGNVASPEEAKPKRTRKAPTAAKRARKVPAKNDEAKPKARTRSRRTPS